MQRTQFPKQSVRDHRRRIGRDLSGGRVLAIIVVISHATATSHSPVRFDWKPAISCFILDGRDERDGGFY
jgi:hypothetical protein